MCSAKFAWNLCEYTILLELDKGKYEIKKIIFLYLEYYEENIMKINTK